MDWPTMRERMLASLNRARESEYDYALWDGDGPNKSIEEILDYLDDVEKRSAAVEAVLNEAADRDNFIRLSKERL